MHLQVLEFRRSVETGLHDALALDDAEQPLIKTAASLALSMLSRVAGDEAPAHLPHMAVAVLSTFLVWQASELRANLMGSHLMPHVAAYQQRLTELTRERRVPTIEPPPRSFPPSISLLCAPTLHIPLSARSQAGGDDRRERRALRRARGRPAARDAAVAVRGRHGGEPLAGDAGDRAARRAAGR